MKRRDTWLVGSLPLVMLLTMGSGTKSLAKEVERTTVNILVTEADTGEPIPNAQLTLTFKEPRGKLRRDKSVSFSGKTNLQGRGRFPGVPKGSFRLLVTAENRQSYGKQLELEQDNQLFTVKLRKPQPIL